MRVYGCGVNMGCPSVPVSYTLTGRGARVSYTLRTTGHSDDAGGEREAVAARGDIPNPIITPRLFVWCSVLDDGADNTRPRPTIILICFVWRSSPGAGGVPQERLEMLVELEADDLAAR
jgi:hypothetical protein